MPAPLGLLFHDIARLLKAEFERRARNSRLTLMQWRTLGALVRQDGQTQAALAARLEVSPMTVSGVLDRLEAMQLVRRDADPDDRRAKRVWIAAEGQIAAREMRAVADDVFGIALAGLSAAELKALETALPQIVDNLTVAAGQTVAAAEAE